tara:strand:- start:23 stop:391 length:369 start_codon:yes stop_codon:yes gene_type:complete
MNDFERARRIDLLSKTMYEYLECFLANDVKNISRYFDWPLTFFTGETFIEMAEWSYEVHKDYKTSVGVQFNVVDINEKGGLVIGTGTRIKKDDSLLETFTAAYSCVYKNNEWKIKGGSQILN